MVVCDMGKEVVKLKNTNRREREKSKLNPL